MKRPEQKAAFSPTKKVAQTRCGRRRQDRTARSRALPRQFAPVPRGGGQPRPEARNENCAQGNRIKRAPASTYESQGRKKETKGPRTGEARAAPHQLENVGAARTASAAATGRRQPRGPPTGAVAGGVGRSETWGGWGCARAWVLELLYRSGRMGGREG